MARLDRFNKIGPDLNSNETELRNFKSIGEFWAYRTPNFMWVVCSISLSWAHCPFKISFELNIFFFLKFFVDNVVVCLVIINLIMLTNIW